ERRDAGWLGQGVGVDAEEERPIDALLLAVLADGLRDGEDMLLVECGREGGAAVARGAEADTLLAAPRIGLERVVGADEPRDVHEPVARRRLTSKRVHSHAPAPLPSRCRRAPTKSKRNVAGGRVRAPHPGLSASGPTASASADRPSPRSPADLRSRRGCDASRLPA